MNQKQRAKLKEITKVLLAKEIDYLELTNAINDYKNFIEALTKIDLSTSEARNDLFFENGTAIGTTWAAICLNEHLRTKRFIQGIFQAVQNLKQKQKKIHICYAGTGPYATLILPLLAYYTKEEIQFTLIEINPLSFNYVKNAISNLDCNDYIKSFELADATKYTFPKDDTVDLVISETMVRSLRREQQVPIVINLMKQLPENTILIPQKIQIDLVYHKSSLEEDILQNIGNIFNLTSRSHKDLNTISNTFPSVTIDLVKPNRKDYHSFGVLTQIQVYKDIWIKYNQCSLTTFDKRLDIEEAMTYKKIETQYVIKQLPEFTYKLC